jgi:hypothetical protein
MELGIGTRLTHPKYGDGVIIGLQEDFYEIYFPEHGEKEISKKFDNMVVVKLIEKEQEDALPIEQIESILRDILEPITSTQEKIYLGERWTGGKLIMQPANRDLQSKELPIETFFHKIVMIRDRVRVMEQKINSSKLSDEEKVDLQQYITRIYGSLTSFNILFRFKEDQFKGSGGD